MNRYFVASIVTMAVLTACSLTSPRDIGNGHRVFLKPLTEKIACHNRRGNLIVAYPKVPETLDTSQIAMRDQNGRWDYFAGMRWADFLPGNVQSTLIQSLSTSGEFSSVSSDDTVEVDRLTLNSEINKFEAVYDANTTAPNVQIGLTFTLRKGGSANIGKQFTASSQVHAAADNADAISIAFEQAFTKAQHAVLKNLSSCSSK